MEKEQRDECLKRDYLLRKRAAREVLSLLGEGYRLVTQSDGCRLCVLRHQNGNRVKVSVDNLGVTVYKNGLLKKIELI